MATPVACPCGSGRPFKDCCGRLHRGAPATTAEELMRARYSAFAVRDEAYLLETWHPATSPGRVEFDPELRWLSLEILATLEGGPGDDEGRVEFIAHHQRGLQRSELHERSRFTRVGGSWVYVAALDP